MKDTKGPEFTGRSGTVAEAMLWIRTHGSASGLGAALSKHQAAYDIDWHQYLNLRTQARRLPVGPERDALALKAHELATRWGFTPPVASPWRDVATDPPNESGDYLAYSLGNGAYVDAVHIWANDTGTHHDWVGYNGYSEAVPTHWMPIPEVPK